MLMLAICLFALFYFLFVGGVEKEVRSIKDWLMRLTLPVVAAIVAFLLGTLVCRTPLAGVIWAVMGWLIPGWVMQIRAERKLTALRRDIRSFIAAASGMYASGQVTPDVVRTAYKMFPDPLASEFQTMIGRHNSDRRALFPAMFEELAVKYDLPEFKALSSIIGASERAGGPKAAAEGLKELSSSLRARDRRISERQKETMQPMIAAGVVSILIAIGFVLDVTVMSHYFASGAGKIVLSITSLMILIMSLVIAKAVSPKDLIGGAH